MELRIALAGNPNSGKTTLFNALTGSNQRIGNWPGVTVEKKEGRLRGRDDVLITDLPGIYSLSPYTPEEVTARNYLLDERPDVILNIVDGSNLERNLYLTTQLTELGIPVVLAVNMMDVVRRNGDRLNAGELSRQLGCVVVEISALRGDGVTAAAEAAIAAAQGERVLPEHTFSGPVEHALAHIEEAVVHDMPEEQQRWYAIKVFERDRKVLERLRIPPETLAHVEADIRAAEKELDDDAESIITSERYVFAAEVIRACFRRRSTGRLSASDRLDRVVTNRWLALPIFAAIMFFVYWTAMVGIGAPATDWANDNLFGDGWHLFGRDADAWAERSDEYAVALDAVKAFCAVDPEAEGFDADAALSKMRSVTGGGTATIAVTDDETLETVEKTVYFDALPQMDDAEREERGVVGISYKDAVAWFAANGFDAPDPARYGVRIPGLPVLVAWGLEKAAVADWLSSLILDGIVVGVGAVLGFVPQMLVLFLMLAFMEDCGYMARVAFILDRAFRRFGLSGKSFIPMLIATGCGVPGIMASRTIENDRDRRMTIMTTTFIPCSAKLPFIAMITGAIFGGSPWVAVSAWFVGLASIVVSGIMLKKTSPFCGDPSPFVMELPAWHWPSLGNVLRATWERGWSFIRKAGSIILISTIVIWFTSNYGFTAEGFRALGEDELNLSILASVGGAVAWIFSPLGWGSWQAAVASITGLVAKENIVGTMGILYGGGDVTAWQALGAAFSGLAAYSFLLFNLLCAPCFAAIGAIRREMNHAGWTWFALTWQCGFAYGVALMVYQFGGLFVGDIGNIDELGLSMALAVLCAMLYMLFFKGRDRAAA